MGDTPDETRTVKYPGLWAGEVFWLIMFANVGYGGEYPLFHRDLAHNAENR